MTRKSAALLVLLIILGFLGNFFTIPLFFGADFLFGSIAVLLVLYFYGLGWGMLAAVMAHSYTYFLWGHPYGFISFILEALFIGIFLKRGRRNLLLLDGLFWLLIGLPLAFLSIGVVLHMDVITTLFIMLKQSINGLFNALLASLIICYLPLQQFLPDPESPRTITLQETLFNLLVALVLFPALVLTMLEIKQQMKEMESRLVTELQGLSANLQSHLRSWHQMHFYAVAELADMASKSTMIPSLRLQRETEIMRQAFPDFRAMFVADAAGTAIAFSPPTFEKGEANLGKNFADRSYFKKLKESLQPVTSEVFIGRASLSPIVILAMPVLAEDRFAGFALGALDLRKVRELLEPYAKDSNKYLTLTDAQSRVIASTLPDREPLHFWDRGKTGVSRPLTTSVYHWLPGDENLPSMTRWRQSFYVQETFLAADLPWKLVVEAPAAPEQRHLYAIYVQNLGTMAVLAAVALLLAYFFSRWLARPLGKLARVTADLPGKLLESRSIHWPDSSALEIHSLIVNFQSMAQALQQNFRELRGRSAELLKANEELETEINDRWRAEEALRESEQNLLNIINFLPDATFVIDKEGKVIAWNRAMEDMTEVKAQDMIGKGNYEYALPFYGARRPILIDLVLNPQAGIDSRYLELIEREDSTLVGEAYMPALRGGEVYLRGTASVLCDSSGNIIGAIESIRDITERHKVKEALQRSEEKYRALMDDCSEGILVADTQGNLLEANKKIEELLGYTKGELLTMNITQIHPPEELARINAAFQEVLQQGSGGIDGGWVRRKDGKTIPVDMTGSRVECAGKTLIQGIFRDITERQKAETERLRFSKLESLGTLAGGIAHDFNNILTAILGNIGLAMLDGKMEARGLERLASAEQACQRAQNLAQQLLIFAKGGAPIKKVTSLPKLIRESAILALAGSKARCAFSLPDDLWAVEVDEGQINQVLHNLLINADQAMPEGGTIEVRADNVLWGGEADSSGPQRKYAKVTIADQGIGIPPKYMDKIFDPYFSTKRKGSGLGLSTAYSIIKNHSGYIMVESEVGVGTTFSIYLPALEVEVPAPKEEIEKLVMGRGRILVMDDDEMVRSVLGAALTRLGYEVEFAGDGVQALELVSKAKKSGRTFAAAILDLTIPGSMGGREALEKLLEIDPEIRAIASSGYSDDPVMADFKKYGFRGVIAKPYRVAEMSKVLREVIKSKD